MSVQGVRRIEALRLAKGIVPAASPGALPEIRWVAPGELFVEVAYQRAMLRRGRELIERLVTEWSWARMKPPIVATDSAGRLCIIDGQHTAIAAATHGGIERIPVLVVALAAEQARAASFVGHNRDRLAMTYAQMHFAGVVAGEPLALAVAEACRRAGCEIVGNVPGEWAEGQTMAIVSVRQVVQRKGPAGGARLLRALKDAGCVPIMAAEIKAAAALLFDAAPKIETADFVRMAASRLPAEWEQRARARARNNPMPYWRALLSVWAGALGVPPPARRQAAGAVA